MNVLSITIPNGKLVDSQATTPVENSEGLLKKAQENAKKNAEEKRKMEIESLVHRACDKNRICYIHDGKRSNLGVLEYLTWVSEDGKIGERVSNDYFKKVCSSYANGTAAVGNNHGGKRKTRKVRRSRK